MPFLRSLLPAATTLPVQASLLRQPSPERSGDAARSRFPWYNGGGQRVSGCRAVPVASSRRAAPTEWPRVYVDSDSSPKPVGRPRGRLLVASCENFSEQQLLESDRRGGPHLPRRWCLPRPPPLSCSTLRRHISAAAAHRRPRNRHRHLRQRRLLCLHLRLLRRRRRPYQPLPEDVHHRPALLFLTHYDARLHQWRPADHVPDHHRMLQRERP
mmetsp:Transcript_9745/g.24045  ORF Transcript_9745/g.24045 Transcript_9745/m.24045 type:complete len:213 (-) Transcript_9745:605-1243(-)